MKRSVRPTLLFVDDRPTSLGDALLARDDVRVVLLRFRQLRDMLGEPYEARTRHVDRFELDLDQPVEREAARFFEWQRREGISVEYFCNPSEPRQRIAHAFARALGLKALSPLQVEWSRDKIRMKEKFRELGFRTADYSPVEATEDVVEFAASRGYPVVVKPREGFSCIDTYLVRGPSEAEALALGGDGGWMVESFIADREYECCALVAGGEVLGIYLTWLPAPLLAAADGAINGSVSMRHVPTDFGVDMGDVMRRLVRGMEVDHGYVHLDFFLGEGRLSLGEIALRIAGVEIPKNHGYSWGFDMLGALVDIHVGRRPRLDYRADRHVGDLLLPVSAGRIVEITPLEELLALEGVIAGKLKVAVGDVVPRRRASHVSAGYVHVEGGSIAEVERRMRRVLEQFRIRVDGGAS